MLSGLRGRLDSVARTQRREERPAAPASGDCLVLRAEYPLDAKARAVCERDVMDMCGAVSYTHLDVYKRQHQYPVHRSTPPVESIYVTIVIRVQLSRQSGHR